MNLLEFYGDVHWENKNEFIKTSIPYIFNFEYVVETESAQPATNKIIVTGSGDFERWEKKPIAVNLANNHIMDLGDEGFLNTLSILKKNKIAYFGAGSKGDNYHNPCIIELNGKKIALLGYCDYVFLLKSIPTRYTYAAPTDEQILRDMNLCRKEAADIIIVNIHWGREERSWYNKRQELLGHRLIDAGADLVIGHHPHCIQPIEIYKNKYIFYSLGNSYFPDLHTPSYYDRTGISEFTAHVKNLKCGRESLKIQYDVENGSIEKIERLEYKNGKIRSLGKVQNLSVVPGIYRVRFINEAIGYFRRFLILIRSNFFVDGKMINGKAFQKEFAFIGARRKRKNAN